MPQTIQIKRSFTTDTTPTSLQPGELAINLVAGALFYGDQSGNVVRHSQPVYVGPFSNNITDPREGMIRFDPNTQNMSVYANSTWTLVGFPQAGGTIGSHLEITIDGDLFLKTTYNNDNDPRMDLTNTRIDGWLETKEGIAAGYTGDQLVWCGEVRTTTNGSASGDIVAANRMVANEFRQTSGGVCAHWADSAFGSARMYITKDDSLDNLNPSSYNNGDIIFGYD